MKHISERRVNQFIDLVNKEYKKNGGSELFYKCVSVCRETENIPFIIEFCAKVKGINAAAHFGNFVAENGTPEQNLVFAQRVFSANKQLHLNVVAKSEDPELCLLGAKTLDYVDITECQKVVLEKGSYYTNYLFARDVNNDGVDYEALQNVIFNSGKVDVVYAFAMDCDGADSYACYNKLKELNATNEQLYNAYKKMTSIYRLKVHLEEIEENIAKGKTHIPQKRKEAVAFYAKQVSQLCNGTEDLLECESTCLKFNNAGLLIELAKTNLFNFEKLSKKIAEVGNGLQNYEFMQYVLNWSLNNPNSEYDIDSIITVNNKSILEYGDAYSSYLVAKNIYPANIKEHEALVLKSKDVIINTLYAKEVNCADIAKHQKVVMEYGSVQDILNFVKSVKGANLEEAYKSISKKGADEKTLNALEKKLNNYQKLNVIINEINEINDEINEVNDEMNK